ncbi:MAG: hypothetical protein R3321_14895, partial [Nitrososphaeraceae archaeon]|nr:hypothetical protein [Nitrososphaeraceae archaeon]
YDNDEDTVLIQFPITVSFPDYTTMTVNDFDTLEDLVDDCIEEGFDDDIECIDLKYPVQFSRYNIELQKASVINIENDESLFNFLANQSDEVIINLVYPIVLITYSGEQLDIINQTELILAIEANEDICDEDDDLDFDDDDINVDDSDFRRVLSSNDWQIELLDSANNNLTQEYSDYIIEFFSDQILRVSNNNEPISGEWDVFSKNENLIITLDFDTDKNLTLLNREWVVQNYSTTQISLRNEDAELPLMMVFGRP